MKAELFLSETIQTMPFKSHSIKIKPVQDFVSLSIHVNYESSDQGKGIYVELENMENKLLLHVPFNGKSSQAKRSVLVERISNTPMQAPLKITIISTHYLQFDIKIMAM